MLLHCCRRKKLVDRPFVLNLEVVSYLPQPNSVSACPCHHCSESSCVQQKQEVRTQEDVEIKRFLRAYVQATRPLHLALPQADLRSETPLVCT